MVVAGGGGFGFHVAGRFFQCQKDAERGRFPVDCADQIAYVPTVDLAALDLDDCPLDLARVVVNEGDQAVNALVCAFLALLAGTIAAIWPRPEQGQGPPLELKTVILGQLPSVMQGSWFTNDYILRVWKGGAEAVFL